jgi:hypothetical protein
VIALCLSFGHLQAAVSGELRHLIEERPHPLWSLNYLLLLPAWAVSRWTFVALTTATFTLARGLPFEQRL